MIILDIETSGGTIYPDRGIWQIAAMELENPKNIFFEEGRIDDSDIVEQGALIVTGKTEQELRDRSKQSQKQLLLNLFKWAEKIKNKNLICHNPQFDYTFLRIKAKKYDLDGKFPFPHKCFDLHTIASMKYLQLNKSFLLDKENKSDMGSSKIFEYCGIPDKRIKMEGLENNSKVKRQGSPHNALEDVKMTAEAFSRLVYGKPLLKDFSQFPIPNYLIIK